MLRDSFDAICELIANGFPEIDMIYTNPTPETFERPCFLVALATGYSDDLSCFMYLTSVTWQIVYFAPLEKGRWPDPYSQLTANDKLQKALMDAQVLTGPSGTVYHITEVEGGPRDNEVYLTVRLETSKRRPEPEYDLMEDIQYIQTIGKVSIKEG
jgi:hypothetical protein